MTVLRTNHATDREVEPAAGTIDEVVTTSVDTPLLEIAHPFG